MGTIYCVSLKAAALTTRVFDAGRRVDTPVDIYIVFVYFRLVTLFISAGVVKSTTITDYTCRITIIIKTRHQRETAMDQQKLRQPIRV